MLYASGEESVRQVALRARRLGLESATLRLAAETRVEAILEEALAARAADPSWKWRSTMQSA